MRSPVPSDRSDLAPLQHLRRLVPQHNLARPPAGLHPDQVDQPQDVEFLQPLEEGRVTDLRPALPVGVDRAGSVAREGSTAVAGRRTFPTPTSTGTPPAKIRFYGSVEIDPIRAKIAFGQIVDEVVMQFTSRPNTTIAIKIEISAEDTGGFDENLQRAIRENSALLGFRSAEFEQE